MPVATIAVAYDGTIVYANPACEKLLGYAASELVGEPVDIVLHDKPPDRTPGGGLICGHPGRLLTLIHADGSPIRTVASESVLLRRDDPMALVFFHDVTDQLWMFGDKT
ncbi:PAS domain S-box protein [Antrihabitans sp. YC2-6]|nr:PAS domain S-box protein [Antrihabitans sp. YC2-6]